MPIEFYCPGCGNLMRTPDETAGRKGRCPTCQLKVQIPANSVASSSSESAVRRSAVAATAKPNVPEPIRFDCGSCGKTLSIAAANAGKRGKCPHCGELMSIPTVKSPDSSRRWKGAPTQQSQPSPAQSSTPAPTKQPTLIKAGGEKIEFRCSNCREVVRVGVAAAGKKGQCPRCKAVIQIPLKSTSGTELQPTPGKGPMPTSPRPQGQSAASPAGLTLLPSETSPLNAPAAAGLTPLPSSAPASSGLTPLDGGGLLPLDSGGLMPLDDGGLSPLEPLGSTPAGLTPLGPAGSGVLGDDLLGIDPFGAAQVNADNPFGANLNPFSAPAAAPAIPRRTARKGARSGPEIASMICGGCLICYAAVQLALVVLSLFLHGFATFAMLDRMREQGDDDQAVAAGVVFALRILAVVVGGIAMLTVLAGGIQMIRFKTWGLCLAACILTMLPCTLNCFCIFGVPFGIWGIVMLSLASVRSAFR